MTIYRHNLGAGSGREIRDPWRRAETFETAPGRYDWSRDANAVGILEAVCAQGVEKVIPFANSPPRRMTKSGYAFARKGSGISHTTAPLNYDAYETSASRDLEKVTGDIGVDHCTFAAESVTTLVFEQRMNRSERLNR